MKRSLAIMVAVVASAAVLAGCGQQSGPAAIVGDVVISERDLASVVSEAEQRALELQVPEVSSQQVTMSALEWMMRGAILEHMIDQLRLTVNKSDVDAVISEAEGQVGRDELEGQIAASGAGPSRLFDYARTYVMQIKLLDHFGGDENALQQAYLGAGEDLGVTISPRFGTWDVMSGGLSQAIDDLSRPEGSAVVVPKS